MSLRNSLTGLKFRRQVPIGAYILDFYCPAAKVCIEVDGPHHLDQAVKDKQRDEALADRLILTVRFSSDEVRSQLDRVVSEIKRITEERAAYFVRESKPNLPDE